MCGKNNLGKDLPEEIAGKLLKLSMYRSGQCGGVRTCSQD